MLEAVTTDCVNKLDWRCDPNHIDETFIWNSECNQKGLTRNTIKSQSGHEKSSEETPAEKRRQ